MVSWKKMYLRKYSEKICVKTKNQKGDYDMTLTDKITQFMATMEMKGYVLSRINNNDILLQYYLSLGVDTSTTLKLHDQSRYR